MFKSVSKVVFLIALCALQPARSWAQECEVSVNSDKTPPPAAQPDPKKRSFFSPLKNLLVGKSASVLLEEHIEAATSLRSSASMREMAFHDIVALGGGNLPKSEIEIALLKIAHKLVKPANRRELLTWFVERGDRTTGDRIAAYVATLPADRAHSEQIAADAEILFEVSVKHGFTKAGADYLDSLDIKEMFALALAPQDDGRDKPFPLSTESVALRKKIYPAFRFWSNISASEPLVDELLSAGKAEPLLKYVERTLALNGSLGYPSQGAGIKLSMVRDEEQDQDQVQFTSPLMQALYTLLKHRLINTLEIPDKRQPGGESRLHYPCADTIINIIYDLKISPAFWSDNTTAEFLYVNQHVDQQVLEFYMSYFRDVLPMLMARTPEDLARARGSEFDISSKKFKFSSLVSSGAGH